MKTAGIILTYMDWRKVNKWFFNIPLFLCQLTFMVIGKIIKKVKVRWRDIWRSAQCSHVRLCLEDAATVIAGKSYKYINFGYPKAELQYWRVDQCDGKRFEYREPTFEPSDEFIAAMIEYARDQVGKAYDVPQLASYCLNLAIWIIWPPSWGREVLQWLNLRGGHEVCSSGVTACLRWAETPRTYTRIGPKAARLFAMRSKYFPIYDTAMVFPCLFPLSENWRVK